MKNTFCSKRIEHQCNIRNSTNRQSCCIRTDWASQFNTIVTIPALYQFSPVALNCWGWGYRVLAVMPNSHYPISLFYFCCIPLNLDKCVIGQRHAQHS